MSSAEQLRQWDQDHVWHPFSPMQAYIAENAPIISRAEGFFLFDTEGNRYLDGISSLWCNVHGHRVPEIDQAIRDQLDRVAHSTLLGLSNVPSIELARKLVEITPPGLNKVFYSDSGATAVEVALKIAWQYHRQVQPQSTERDLFLTLDGAYHGDTIGSVSLGNIDLFHHTYGGLLFQTRKVPSPVALRRPEGFSAEEYLDHCWNQMEQAIVQHHQRLVAVVIEPLVQGAAGILVHPPGYLRKLRKLTQEYGVLLIADEVAVGFGRTGTMFASEQEHVTPDLLCLAKGMTGGYLAVAATLATDAIYNAFLGDPSEGKTFYHGHTYTGNPLGCAAALATLDLFEKNQVMAQVKANESHLAEGLAPLLNHPHVGEVRQKGMMVGIELVQEKKGMVPFESALRVGHQVTLAARKRGVIVRPLGNVIVLMPAPAMPGELIQELCQATLESIEEALNQVRSS